MYTAESAQRVGQWAPEVSYVQLPYTGEVTLPYTVYKLVWEERSMVEHLATEELVLAKLYAEFAEEDRELAEMGLADYVRLLREEEVTA